MIGLVLVTHGRLAAEFLAAMEHVVGPQAMVQAVCIGAEDDIEQRRGRDRRRDPRGRRRQRRRGADRHVRRHAVQPRHLDHGPQGHRGDRRRQPADADQARQRARRRAAARGGDAPPRRPGASTSTSRASCSTERRLTERPDTAGHDRATSAACMRALRPSSCGPPRVRLPGQGHPRRPERGRHLDPGPDDAGRRGRHRAHPAAEGADAEPASTRWAA